VLEEIGAAERPVLEVYNKLDLLEAQPRVDRDADGVAQRVWLSASSGEGCALLEEVLAERLGGDLLDREVALGPEQARLRAALYELGAVEAEHFAADGCAHLQVRLPRADWDRLMAREAG
jgi:GTP-binding protein HflX